MTPDDLRNAYHRVWMKRYLNRGESLPFKSDSIRRQKEIEELEYYWNLQERGES